MIDPRELITDSSYELLIGSFQLPSREAKPLLNRRENFYGLQKLLHAVLGRLGEFNADPGAGRFMCGEYQPFKGDGFDGLRVVKSLTENFCKQSIDDPAPIWPMSTLSHEWPIVLGAGANAITDVLENSTWLHIGRNLTRNKRPRRKDAGPAEPDLATTPSLSKPASTEKRLGFFTGIPADYYDAKRADTLSCLEEQKQIADSEFEWLLRSLLPERRNDIRISVYRTDFYALQKLLAAVLGRLGEYNADLNAQGFMCGALRLFRADGRDGLRVVQSVAENFCEQSIENTAVIRPLSEKAYGWPILHEEGANNELRIKAKTDGLGIGLCAQLRLKRSRKGVKIGQARVRSTWDTLEVMDSAFESEAVCNAVLIHHFNEITAYSQRDTQLTCRFQRNEKVRRDFHNASVRNQQMDSTFVHRPTLAVKSREMEIPEFWVSWQARLEALNWDSASVDEQFEVIWEKILGEYLDAPEKAPRNVVFDTQQDLRPIGKFDMIACLRTSKRFLKMEPFEARRMIERELNEDRHAGRTFQCFIENRLWRAFLKLRGVKLRGLKRRKKRPVPPR